MLIFSWILWVPLIGLCVGLLVGKKKKNGGFGIFGNILIGVAGSIVGSIIFGILHNELVFVYRLFATNHIVWLAFNYVGAFVGACLLLWIFSRFKRKKNLTEEAKKEQERQRRHREEPFQVAEENRKAVTAWVEKNAKEKREQDRKEQDKREQEEEKRNPIPATCPHCKNPNTKKLRECEWCGNEI